MPGDAPLNLLCGSQRPAAVAILARTDATLARWEQVVRRAVPAAERLTAGGLRDDLLAVLTELAATLTAGDGDPSGRLLVAADAHGRCRCQQSYAVDAVLLEFGLLRPILLDEVTTHLGRPLAADESAAVHAGLDAAVRHSVTRFTADQQDRLRSVAEAQSKYLSFLSHDLRGSLNGVMLMVEVLKRELAGEPRFAESMQDLDAMRRSILDTVATMDRFLHAERFRAGKVQPRMASMDLRQTLGDVMAGVGYLCKDQGVELQFDIPAGLAVVTDRDLLVLIVQNLVTNAVKFTRPGTAVRLSAAGDGGGPICVSVVDHGPGIADDRLATLFDPFTRGETHGQPGVGLGLSIARQAADLLGADLRVQSTLGSGSRFTLTLN